MGVFYLLLFESMAVVVEAVARGQSTLRAIDAALVQAKAGLDKDNCTKLNTTIVLVVIVIKCSSQGLLLVLGGWAMF